MALLPIDLATLGSLCGGVLHASGGIVAMATAMLIAGAAGGATHCAAMCGPLVLAQVAALPAPACAWARLTSGARAPYHIGRLAMYSTLGALAGAVGRGLVRGLSLGAAPVALVLALAACVVAWAAWRGGKTVLPGRLSAWIASTARPLIQGKGWWGGLRLGLVLGLLPCGLVYAALSVAAATADPLVGAGLMLAFGLGTVPGLVAIGTVGRALGLRFGRSLAPLPVFANAAVLAILAWRAWAAS